MSYSVTNKQRKKSSVISVMLDITVFRNFFLRESKILRYASQYNDLHKVLEKLINSNNYGSFVVSAQDELTVIYNHLTNTSKDVKYKFDEDTLDVFVKDCHDLYKIRPALLASNPRITGNDIHQKPNDKKCVHESGDSIRLICFHPLSLSNEIPTHYFGYITQLSNVTRLTAHLLKVKEEENVIPDKQ
jgi:hypothetical protein